MAPWKIIVYGIIEIPEVSCEQTFRTWLGVDYTIGWKMLLVVQEPHV